MNLVLRRLIPEYGMFLVLLLLCAFFSFVTYSEQSSTGEAGADQVASEIARQAKPADNVLIVTRRQTDDIRFADKLQRNLASREMQVAGVVQGEPQDARVAMERLLQENQKIDFVACSQASADWRVFANIPVDFPNFGNPRVVQPYVYYWPNFLKFDNLLNISNQISVIAVVAIGMTMVIVSGGIDLSVGSLIALSAVLSARIIRDFAGATDATTTGMTLACIIAILCCGAIGAFSACMITYFGIPPFIVTLAMMLVGSGFAYMLSEGQSIAAMPDTFVWLGRDASLFGLPNAVVLMVALYALAHLVMSRMTLGRYLYAVGGNREAARLSGVPVERVIVFAYVVCGLLAGLGGVVLASQLKSGSATYGNMYELYVIAAVVVGGTSLSGGEGKMPGTLIGAFTIAVIQNGMNLTNVESYTQKVVLGFVILGAVLLDQIRGRRYSA
ncbi:MAG: ABC transporter permease [Planctomycetota bacterium]|nr:ABC transporter permease [Planctomycetota bacterium]